MYNRYVPQADGSYRRNRMEEQRQPQPQRQKEPPKQQHGEDCLPEHKHQEVKQHGQHHGQNVGGFLRQLLPKDFDTADLIVILLLLLLAGDCEEDKTTAMLTLVLYLFM